MLIGCLCFFSSTYAQKTLWEEMPSSREGRFDFFKKNSPAVFDQYNQMRGTRIIFVCVNAYVFHIFAFQNDSLKDSSDANNLVNEKCGERSTYFIGKEKNTIAIPFGTPILLKFEKDYKAFDAYLKSVEKWRLVAKNDQSEVFIYKDAFVTTERGYKRVWLLTNFNKTFPAASGVTLREFDCMLKQYRFIKAIHYDEKYGQGKKINETNNVSEWTVGEPGSIPEVLIYDVCK